MLKRSGLPPLASSVKDLRLMSVLKSDMPKNFTRSKAFLKNKPIIEHLEIQAPKIIINPVNKTLPLAKKLNKSIMTYNIL